MIESTTISTNKSLFSCFLRVNWYKTLKINNIGTKLKRGVGRKETKNKGIQGPSFQCLFYFCLLHQKEEFKELIIWISNRDTPKAA